MAAAHRCATVRRRPARTRRIGVSSVGFASALLSLVAMAAMAVAIAGAANTADDEEPAKLPGLLASYTVPPAGAPILKRLESVPTFLLSPGESPDPRLPLHGWQAHWSGVLQVLHPGKYRFSAVHSGGLKILVGGKTALDEPRPVANLAATASPDQPGALAPLDLPFGLAPLEIDFQPQRDATVLKIYWQSDKLAREPLPSAVLGHTRESSAEKNTFADAFATGRLAVEEHSCTACHRPSDEVKLSKSLIARPGPRLTDAGGRLNAAWIYHWLDNPQATRPEAVMPRLFGDDDRGRVERYAVAMYLASPKNAPAAEPTEGEAQLAARGERLYNQIGCIVCHEKQGSQPPRATLSDLGQKFSSGVLAAYLMNPASCDPAGRMPSMNLDQADATAIAIYLIRRDQAGAKPLELPAMPPTDALRDALTAAANSQIELSAEQAMQLATEPPEKRLAAMGREIMVEKNCAACHEFTPPGEKKPLEPKAAAHDFAAIAKAPTAGCVADVSTVLSTTASTTASTTVPIAASTVVSTAANVPRFGPSLDRIAAAAFLKQSLTAPGTPAPGEFARLTLARMNCLGCHVRDGAGGLTKDAIAKIAENQSPEMAELVMPPPLTDVTDKLLGTYMHAVLLDGRRSRGWMSLRMPQFSKSLVENLPAELAALEGNPLRDVPRQLASDPASEKSLDDAGRTLVGSKGFGCTKCHDMLGKPSGGTRGPDLSLVAERVNFDWFDRWMIDPQRIQPGTRMPTVFLNGASPYKDILAGDAERQRRAIWSYLSHSRSLPPPDGLENEKPAEVVEQIGSEYETVRSFMPELAARAMAIRFANGVHVGYDLQACRLAYAWSGGFVDMSPAWTDRGGQKIHLLGPIVWKSPAGFPWDITPSSAPIPDFSARGTDVSLGAILKLDAKFQPTRLDFRGYQLTAGGPTFRYELQLDGSRRAKFHETIHTIHGEFADGVLRDARVELPAGRTVWLNVAEGANPPQWSTPDGKSGQLDDPDKTAPADAVVRCLQAGKPLVLHVRSVGGAADRTVWQASKQGDHWTIVLRAAPAGNAASDTSEARFVLAVLCPANATATDSVAAAESQAK